MKHPSKWCLALLCLWLAGCAGLSPDNSQDGAMPSVPMTTLHSNGVATLTAPDDLWERIRRGFAMPDLDNAEVAQQQAWYLERPGTMQRMAERSRRYLFHIVEQLELRDMPTELALLPYVESAFNPEAVSSAKAAGLWQFIPSTGTLFDLDQNAWSDDRRNVIASTRAALDYLQELYDQFEDWQLALAAYNWGPGNVARAMARNTAQDLGTRYADLQMPRETAQYVPRLQALKNIIATPDAFGVALPSIGNHPFFDTVTITKDIDIAMAAQLAGISLDDFKALNPSFKRPIIRASGTAQILLPWDNASQFKHNLSQTDPDSLASWTLWHAPANMSVSEVAQQFAMSERDLRRLNEIPRQRTTIDQGSAILVRRGGSTLLADASTGQKVVASAAATTPKAAAAPQSVLTRTVVKAQQGDSITGMAARYDLPANTVAKWNKTRENAALQAGHEVVMYLPREQSQTAAMQPGKVRVGTRTATARKPRTTAAASKTQGKVAIRTATQPTAPAATALHGAKTRVQTARK